MSKRITDQPPPVANGTPPLWERVVAKWRAGVQVPAPQNSIVVRAIELDMLERDQIGRERYGVPLQAHNGRDPLVDAYQEALDLRVYLEQATVEGRVDKDRADRLTALANQILFVLREGM